jgi:hypothetical protein
MRTNPSLTRGGVLRVALHCSIVLGLGSFVCAQSPPVNQFGIYPEATTFTSRSGTGGNSAGDVLTEIGTAKCLQPNGRADNMLGTGQAVNGGGALIGRVNGFRVVIQDQNASTPESFSHVILPAAASGGPDSDPAHELLRTGPLQAPSGTGTLAWILTTTLATPADVVPQVGAFYFGEGLDPNPAWTADGLSVHAASHTLGTVGDNPDPTAPNLTWSISRPAPGVLGAVNPQPTARVHQHYLLTERPVLNSGAVIDPSAARGPDPNFGVAGLYPNRGRADGLAFRYRDESAVGASWFVLGNLLGLASTPLQLPIVEGGIWLDLTLFLPSPFASGTVASGDNMAVVAPFPQPIPLGRLSYQAFRLGTGGIVAANATSSEDASTCAPPPPLQVRYGVRPVGPDLWAFLELSNGEELMAVPFSGSPEVEDFNRLRVLGYGELQLQSLELRSNVVEIARLESGIVRVAGSLWQTGFPGFGGTPGQLRVLSRLSQLLLLFHEKARPFLAGAAWTANGCTAVPDFNFKHCCDAHDACYCAGGKEADRKICDQALRACIIAAGHPVLARIYYWGVRAFGKSHFSYRC